jgi:hypothetical protein
VAGVAFTVGVGLTIIVAVVTLEQVPAVAVMVNVVVCVVLVVLVNVPDIGDPVPLAAMPVRFAVLSLVQLKVVPATALGLVITILEIAEPEHTV